MKDGSVSPDSAVELLLGNGSIDLHVLIGPNRNVSAGVEISRLGGVNVTCSLLSFVVGQLHRKIRTHWLTSVVLPSTTLLVGK